MVGGGGILEASACVSLSGSWLDLRSAVDHCPVVSTFTVLTDCRTSAPGTHSSLH